MIGNTVGNRNEVFMYSLINQAFKVGTVSFGLFLTTLIINALVALVTL